MSQRATRLCVGLLSLATFASAARAQHTPVGTGSGVPAASTGPAVSPEDAVKEMKIALRGVMARQEAHASDHGTYTTDLTALNLVGQHGSVRVQIRAAGGSGWNGRVTHRSLRGKSCVAFVGDYRDVPTPLVTDGGKTRPDDEGRIVCDKP